jgi:hypothetical protein
VHLAQLQDIDLTDLYTTKEFVNSIANKVENFHIIVKEYSTFVLNAGHKKLAHKKFNSTMLSKKFVVQIQHILTAEIIYSLFIQLHFRIIVTPVDFKTTQRVVGHLRNA